MTAGVATRVGPGTSTFFSKLSISSISALALGTRDSGFFSSSRATKFATSLGISNSGRIAWRGGGSFWRWASSISMAVSALKGSSPASIWYMTTPRE
jgi:hypothetical protein